MEAAVGGRQRAERRLSPQKLGRRRESGGTRAGHWLGGIGVVGGLGHWPGTVVKLTLPPADVIGHTVCAPPRAVGNDAEIRQEASKTGRASEGVVNLHCEHSRVRWHLELQLYIGRTWLVGYSFLEDAVGVHQVIVDGTAREEDGIAHLSGCIE